MRPATLVRLALAGTRTDLLRVVLTGVSAALATLAVLAALTVLAIPTPGPPGGSGSLTWSAQYSNALLREPGLRGGVAFAFVLLTVPILALAGQCARLGAPARDRRLAGYRLAGATPRQAVAVATAETAVASLLGALVALGGYLAGREWAHRPDANGQLPLPTDVLPSPVALALAVLGLPVLAGLAAALLLRRVTMGPFGVVRRAPRTRPPRPWPGLLIGVGVAAFAGLVPLVRWLDRQETVVPAGLIPLVLFGGALLAATGVILGTGWVSYGAGRLLHRYGRGPAALLAARRLTADPWTGSRTLAALLACVVIGAGAVGVRAWLLAEIGLQEERSAASAAAQGEEYAADTDRTDFFTRSMDLVDLAVWVALAIAAGGLLVAVAEGIVSRRRAYASLVATGVPRGTLARAVLLQALAPAVPAVGVALAVGATLPRGIASDVRHGGFTSQVCRGGANCEDPANWQDVFEPLVVRPIPVLWDQLAALGGGALAAVLGTVVVGLMFLRGSTAVEELRVG